MNIQNNFYVTKFPLFITILFILAGCASDDISNVESGTRNQILHLGNGTEPQSLDPHIVTGDPDHRVTSALLEGLVGLNPKDLTPEPAVAESWEISDDGTIYTFHIRNDARWSNGEPVTAGDFVYSWKRSLMPLLGNQYAYMLFPVLNAEAFYTGEVADFSKVGVKAINDHTLQVTLSHATPYFLGMLNHDSTYPVHQKTIEKFGEIDSRNSEWTRAGNFIGNGAFVLKEWKQNQIIIAERNPYYWDKDNVKLNAVHFYPIDQLATEERMFRTGQLHLTYSIPLDKIDTYRRENPEVLVISPFLGTYFYDLNTDFPPLDDVRVRRALAMSIDRKAIVENITKGGQLPAHTLTPPDTLGYTARAHIPYDIDKARELLAEAGFPNGKGFPTIQLLYNTYESHRQIAVAIQQMWKQALNIDITLHNQEWKVYLDNRVNQNYQIVRASWVGDYVDPNTFLDMYVTNGGNNRTGWGNEQYDLFIKNAAEASDQVSRYEYFQKAEEILMNEVPLIPIYTYTAALLKSPEVKGWHANILDRHPLKYIYLTPQAAE